MWELVLEHFLWWMVLCRTDTCARPSPSAVGIIYFCTLEKLFCFYKFYISGTPTNAVLSSMSRYWTPIKSFTAALHDHITLFTSIKLTKLTLLKNAKLSVLQECFSRRKGFRTSNIQAWLNWMCQELDRNYRPGNLISTPKEKNVWATASFYKKDKRMNERAE